MCVGYSLVLEKSFVFDLNWAINNPMKGKRRGVTKLVLQCATLHLTTDKYTNESKEKFRVGKGITSIHSIYRRKFLDLESHIEDGRYLAPPAPY